MTDTPNPTDKKLLAGYITVPTAPFVYFDYVPTHGILGGAVQIELAARILLPTDEGGVQTGTIETGRLRCSPAAAKYLKEALEAALKMLEQPSSPATTGVTLN